MHMKVFFIILTSSIFNSIYPTYAFAYLDPGTGSIILQAIIAFIAGIIAYMSFFWLKLKMKLRKKLKKLYRQLNLLVNEKKNQFWFKNYLFKSESKF